MTRRRVALALLCLLALGVLWVSSTAQVNQGTPLDPEGVTPDGAKALATVLADHGVDVTIVRTRVSYEQLPIDADTTVVVSNSANLGRRSVRALRDDEPGRRVFLDFTSALASELDYPKPVPTSQESQIDAGCEGNYQEEFEGLTLTVEPSSMLPTLAGCFPSEAGGWFLASPQSEVLIVGPGTAFSNRQIVVDDNAAIALRMLGQHPKLVWYAPSIADSPPSDALGAAAETPLWLVPSVVLIALAMTTAVWWRARRLGPLEQEALPVQVPSLETTTSRGHLYQLSGARAYAFSQIQATTTNQLAARWQTGHDREALVAALTKHTSRSSAEISRLLDPATVPASNAEFSKLTNELSLLSHESDIK